MLETLIDIHSLVQMGGGHKKGKERAVLLHVKRQG